MTSKHVLPQKQLPKLIVVQAFDRDEEGELQTAFGPTEMQSEDRAVRAAKALATKHESVIAWSRTADIVLGEYGAPTILFQQGETPEME